MDTRIKLLQQDLTSHGGCRWTVGEWKETTGKGELCGPGWLHCYESVELAVLLNPIHANIRNPAGYTVEVDGAVQHDHGLKTGYTRMRLMEPIVLPSVTTEQRVRFALACALAGRRSLAYRGWALSWLDGTDRSAEAAAAEVEEARAAAWAAAEAAAWAAEFPLQRLAEWALSDEPYAALEVEP